MTEEKKQQHKEAAAKRAAVIEDISNIVVELNDQIRSGRYKKVKHTVVWVLTRKKSISNKNNREHLHILLNSVRALEKNNSDMLNKAKKFAQLNGLSL